METEGTRRSDFELRALQRAADEVTAAQDLAEALRRSLEMATQMASTPSASIYLRDDRQQRFVRHIAQDTLHSEISLPTQSMDQWFSQKPSHLVELATLPPDLAAHDGVVAARAAGVLATLNLAMRWHGQLIGVLILAFRDRATVPESTIRTLEALMNVAAAAVENARTRRLLELRAHLSQTLRDFSERALAVGELEGLWRLILEVALMLSGGDRGLVARFGDGGAKVVAGIGCCEELVGNVVPAGDRYVAASLAHPEPLVLEDVNALDDRMPIVAAAKRQSTASMLLVTLRLEHGPIGQVIIGSGVPRIWEGEVLEALRTLASMAGQLVIRAESQGAVERERRRLGELLETLPVAVVVLDRTMQPVHMNAATREFAARFDIRDDFLSRIKITTVDGRPVPTEQLAFARALRGERASGALTLFHPPDGQGRPIALRADAAPLFDADGKVSMVVIAFQDVSELRELAEAKDRFLRIASHELRSPITSLRATTQLLTLDPEAVSDPARRATMLDRIDRQSGRLIRLVEQLLDATRTHGTEVPLQLAELELVALCREVIEGTGPRVHLEAEAPVHGRWDPLRLDQALRNLVENALRYSDDPAPVLVRVRRIDERRVKLQVIDHGIGIPVEEQAKLFTPFYRVQPGQRHRPGLGLGLYITREIVQRHGGEITVTSTPGAGSTFEIDLPLDADAR